MSQGFVHNGFTYNSRTLYVTGLPRPFCDEDQRDWQARLLGCGVIEKFSAGGKGFGFVVRCSSPRARPSP